MRKKLAILLTLVLIIGLSVAGSVSQNISYAREAQLYMEIPESIKKEDEFKVKVILNSDVDLYSIDAYLSYNAELLEFIPDNEFVTGAEGVLELKDTYEQETKNISYEITFKALDTGTAEIALTDIFLIDYADLDYIEVVPSVKHFEIGINKQLETDAGLSELLVAPGTLTETFRPEQMEYEMYVGMDVEMIGVTAIPMDEGSVVGLEMPDRLQVGENTVVITVTALSGNVNTYIIKVYREEIIADTNETVTGEENQPVADSSEQENSMDVQSVEGEEGTVTTPEPADDDSEIGDGNTEQTTEMVSDTGE